ncbi:MAG: hypothetical protein ACYCZ0_02485 [Minisyncoccota bacterium]
MSEQQEGLPMTKDRSFTKALFGKVSPKKKGSLTDPLSGWSGPIEMPSIDDVRQMYRRPEMETGTYGALTAVANQLVNGPDRWFNELAIDAKSFRGATIFEREGRSCCGLFIHKPFGSFFMVFELGGEKSVNLYCMGVIDDPNADKKNPVTSFLGHCTSVVREFDVALEHFVFKVGAFAPGVSVEKGESDA